MKDNKVFLRHIFESIEKIQEYLNGFSEEDFMRDEMRFSANVLKILNSSS